MRIRVNSHQIDSVVFVQIRTNYIVTLTLYWSKMFRKKTTTIFLMTFPSNSGGTKYTLINC